MLLGDKVLNRVEAIRDMVEDALENFILERMSRENEAIPMGIAKETLLAGGKRMRPILGLLAFEACGGEEVSDVMDSAISAELLHTATLIHDDINDQAKMRRGRPALHVTHGIPRAIIAGDYLFSIGFQLGAGYSENVVNLVASSCFGLAAGELRQLNHVRDLSMSPEDYYAIIDGKTAGPFSTGGAVAAIVAGAPKEQVDLMKLFGIELGRAFQLVDDLLDLIGDKTMGKPRGTDIHEGKMTLPLIHGLTILHGTEREQLEDVLTNFSDARWEELMYLLECSGSIDYSRCLIGNHVDRAIGYLEELPESKARTMMLDMAENSRFRTT